AGTTRDVIEVRMDLAGLPVTLLDTAGLRATDDRVEAMGVDLARRRAAAADLRVFLLESDEVLPFPAGEDDIILLSKGDIQSGTLPGISGHTGLGVAELIAQIGRVLSGRA